jgi:hypothetical protein
MRTTISRDTGSDYDEIEFMALGSFFLRVGCIKMTPQNDDPRVIFLRRNVTSRSIFYREK